MTYTDAQMLKKRARLAYTGLSKRAADKPTSAENQKAKEIYGSTFPEAEHTERMEANLADLAKQRKDNWDAQQARVAADYTAKMNGVVNRAKGEEEARQRAAANDYLQNQVPQNIDDAQLLKMLEMGTLPPELYSQAAAALSRQKDMYASAHNDRLADDAHTASQDAAADAKVKAYQQEQEDVGNAVAEAEATARRNRNYGIGAGALGGLAAGGAAYGLAGLFPSLRKRRLLRALIALGVGGAAGTGIGIGTTRGLNSGAIQGAYAKAKGMLS